MYCKKCGALLPENVNFCTRCGQAIPAAPVPKASAAAKNAAYGNLKELMARPVFKGAASFGGGILLSLMLMAVLSLLFTGYTESIQGQPYRIPQIAAFEIILTLLFGAWIFFLVREPLESRIQSKSYGLAAAIVGAVFSGYLVAALAVQGSFSYLTEIRHIPVSSILASTVVVEKSKGIGATPGFILLAAILGTLLYFTLKKMEVIRLRKA